MSLKAKLVSTIAAFAMVLALMVVGVFAATSGTVQMGGKVSFTATDVVGSVTLSSSGQSGAALSETQPFDADDDTIAVNWENLNLELAKSGTPITITLTIENDATDRSFWVTFDALPSAGGTDATRITISTPTYGSAQDVTAGRPIEVAQASEIVVTFTIGATDFNNSIDATWSCAFDISNTQA